MCVCVCAAHACMYVCMCVSLKGVVVTRESMQSDELRRGFVEAIQQWTHNNVTTSLPDNQELQHSDSVIVKKPIHLKQNNKALRYTLNANAGVSLCYTGPILQTCCQQ